MSNIHKEYGMHKNTFLTLFMDSDILKKEEYQPKEYYNAYLAINLFTIYPFWQKFLFLLSYKEIKKSGIPLSKIHYDFLEKKYFYKDDSLVIPFLDLCAFLQKNLSIDYASSLYKEYRLKKCHLYGHIIAMHIKKSKILIGFIIRNQRKILHSVVQIERDGKIYYADCTMNAIFLKDDYEKLFQFQVLNSITHDTLLEDMSIFEHLLSSFREKIYLLFRDEIIKDLSKNSFLFQEDEGYSLKKN